MLEPEPTECSWFAGGDPGQQCEEPIYSADLCREHLLMWRQMIRAACPER